ncbi:MAG: MOSC domain-containing protein, partial [Persicimonas sp.]
MGEPIDKPGVSGLWVYPLKSASGVRLDQAEVDARGFALDRRWMLVDSDGGFMTQRKHPRLALVGCAIDDKNLVLTGPGRSALEVPLRLALGASAPESMQVHIWGSECRALYVGQQADRWFSEFLGVECRLVFMPASTRRRVDSEAGCGDDIVSFADGYPFLLVGQSSLDDLNARLAEPVPMDRFRPNIVVETDEPFAEDTWT